MYRLFLFIGLCLLGFSIYFYYLHFTTVDGRIIEDGRGHFRIYDWDNPYIQGDVDRTETQLIGDDGEAKAVFMATMLVLPNRSHHTLVFKKFGLDKVEQLVSEECDSTASAKELIWMFNQHAIKVEQHCSTVQDPHMQGKYYLPEMNAMLDLIKRNVKDSAQEIFIKTEVDSFYLSIQGIMDKWERAE